MSGWARALAARSHGLYWRGGGVSTGADDPAHPLHAGGVPALPRDAGRDRAGGARHPARPRAGRRRHGPRARGGVRGRGPGARDQRAAGVRRARRSGRAARLPGAGALACPPSPSTPWAATTRPPRLDVGATVRCEAEELVHFALMGSAYARRVSKVASPAVGLLNMGSEETKGGEVLAEAHRRLRQLPVVNFVGNVEGNDLVRGRADVIVCEGLLGNVALKLIEGISEVLYDLSNQAAERRVAWRLGLRLLARGIERLRALSDYTQYGGSPILGFEHLCIKCHGRSSARAIGNAVKVAAKAVRDHVPREIADALAAVR